MRRKKYRERGQSDHPNSKEIEEIHSQIKLKKNLKQNLN